MQTKRMRIGGEDGTTTPAAAAQHTPDLLRPRPDSARAGRRVTTVTTPSTEGLAQAGDDGGSLRAWLGSARRRGRGPPCPTATAPACAPSAAEVGARRQSPAQRPPERSRSEYPVPGSSSLTSAGARGPGPDSTIAAPTGARGLRRGRRPHRARELGTRASRRPANLNVRQPGHRHSADTPILRASRQRLRLSPTRARYRVHAKGAVRAVRVRLAHPPRQIHSEPVKKLQRALTPR